MPNEEQGKRDLFGLAAYGETLNTLAKGVVDGAGAFLSRICLPAAEEFGLLLRDKVVRGEARGRGHLRRDRCGARLRGAGGQLYSRAARQFGGPVAGFAGGIRHGKTTQAGMPVLPERKRVGP